MLAASLWWVPDLAEKVAAAGGSPKDTLLADLYKYNGLIFDSSFAKKPAYDSLVASLKSRGADKVTKFDDALPLVWENTSPCRLFGISFFLNAKKKPFFTKIGQVY